MSSPFSFWLKKKKVPCGCNKVYVREALLSLTQQGCAYLPKEVRCTSFYLPPVRMEALDMSLALAFQGKKCLYKMYQDTYFNSVYKMYQDTYL